jgi:hypothetical protein
MQLRFSGPVTFWKGPSPWHFVPIPDEESELIASNANDLTYGWGCIPVRATIRSTTFSTSLFPKDGIYMLPVKTDVRRSAGVDLGDVVDVTMDLGA